VKYNDVKIILVETYPCKSRDELTSREEHWRVTLPRTCNKIRCKGIPREQYWAENKDVFNKRRKVYRDTHKELVRGQKRRHSITHKDYIAKKNKEWREKHKDHIAKKNKEWREKHKDHIAKKNKEYRESNKEQIAERRRELWSKNKVCHARKLTCECGSIVNMRGRNAHYKTGKHRKFIDIEQKNNNKKVMISV